MLLLSFLIMFIINLSEGNIESLWVELFPNSKRAILVCCAYRSPSDCHFFDNLMIECEKGQLSYCQKLVILGDLNSNPVSSVSQQTKFLRSFMNQFHLSELVQSPTRVTATSRSQLDLLLTNSPSYFWNTVAIPFSGSDHHAIVSFFVLVALASLVIIRLFIHGSFINLTVSCLTAYFWMILGLLFLMWLM